MMFHSSFASRMLRRIAVAVAAFFAWLPRLAHGDDSTPFAVYYAATATADELEPYDLLVLDHQNHPPLEPLVDRGKTVLGYLSVGEIASDRPWFDEVREEGILLGENENWKGSFMVDLRDPRWTARVVEEMVPRVLQAGFKGVFLDTLDNAGHLERTDAARFRGMSFAGVRLVRAIRRHYPDMPIMVNRAYDLLPRIAKDVDMVLGESVYTTYDWKTKKYKRVSERDYELQLGFLREAARVNPEVRIFTLDYWDPDDAEGVAEVYATERANGFSPYVATIELNRIVPEPKGAKARAKGEAPKERGP